MKKCTKKRTEYIVAIAFFLAIIAVFSFVKIKEKRTEALQESMSTTAIVCEKYTAEGKGTHFYVVGAHEAVNHKGESVTAYVDYKVPWEEYLQIEIGDTIITEYHGGVIGWRYVSFVSQNEEEEELAAEETDDDNRN